MRRQLFKIAIAITITGFFACFTTSAQNQSLAADEITSEEREMSLKMADGNNFIPIVLPVEVKSRERTGVIFYNGPVITHPGGGAGGADVSAIPLPEMISWGHNANISENNNSRADDFVIETASFIETIEFNTYQTGSGTTSTITGVFVQIWDGSPMAGGSVIWGDLTTNRMVGNVFSNIYRTNHTDLLNTERPIMKVTANVGGLMLPAGTYWVQVGFSGTGSSGPWANPVSIFGEAPNGNAIGRYNNVWENWVDGGNNSQQELPFVIYGRSIFSSGDGSEENPFIISTADELAALAELINGSNSANYDTKHYKLNNDIDLNVAPYNTGQGWTSIGNHHSNNLFKGVFDGNEKVISGLFINNSTQNTSGLFGFLSATAVIKNLGIENVDITLTNTSSGGYNVGGLARENNGVITNCYVTGSIKTTGFSFAGGLVCINYGTISDCYTICSIDARSAGGIVTDNYGTVTNCYSLGNISGSYVGGISGDNISSSSSIKYCVALQNSISCTTNSFGRIVGSFSSTTLSDNAAYNEMLNPDGEAVWNTDIGHDQQNGADITIDELLADGTIGGRFTQANGWTTLNGKLPGLFGKTVEFPLYFCPGQGTEDFPFIITTAAQLAQLATEVNASNTIYNDKYYKLGNDINLSNYQSGEGWIPIGKYISSTESQPFKGFFDGNNKKITGLKINSSSLVYSALFGCIEGGEVKNLGVENVNIVVSGISTDALAAAVVGICAGGTVKNCYSTGKISATSVSTGAGAAGVVGGALAAFIYDCYSTCTVSATSTSGTATVGGVLAAGYFAGVSNSYSTGEVTAFSDTDYAYAGGIAGNIFGIVSDCAALNPQINCEGSVSCFGRVAGSSSGGADVNNIAYSGMLNPYGEKTWHNIGLGDIDGADFTVENICADGTLGARFKTAEGWTAQNGKLPGLFGNTVNYPAHLLPYILTETLPSGTTGLGYNQKLSSLNNATWTIVSGNLPTGLNLSSDGTIIGVPSERGDFIFTVRAENCAGAETKQLLIFINSPGYPKIITTSLPNGKIGEVYDALLEAESDTDVSWSLENGSLPPGINLSSDGMVIGIPSENGIFTFIIKATNSVGDNSREFSINIGNVNFEQLQITNYELRVYPNPTNGELKIENGKWRVERGEWKVEIYDVLGRCVFISPSFGEGRGEVCISHLPNGMYMLKIGNQTIRVMKK